MKKSAIITVHLFIVIQISFAQNNPTGFPEIALNKIIYRIGEPITANLFTPGKSDSLPNPVLLFLSSVSKDVEYLTLAKTTLPGNFSTRTGLKTSRSGKNDKKLDGVLSLNPDETFFCYYFPDSKASPAIFDFGAVAGEIHKQESPHIYKDLNKIFNETDPLFGTIFLEKNLPVAVSSSQIIFHPLNREQADRFLARTKGKIIDKFFLDKKFEYTPRASFLIEISRDKLNDTNALNIPVYRKILNLQNKLHYSDQHTANITNLLLELLLDGYLVEFNIKGTSSASPFTSESQNQSLTDPLFNILQVQSFISLWDRDDARIPIAFLDQGFAPNGEYRQPLVECNLAVLEFCGSGSAVGPEISLDGNTWHGNGTVMTATGIFNNGIASYGTGGQVAVPQIYRVILAAFDLAKGIQKAVENGAAIISISQAFACKIPTNILGWTPGICSRSERAAVCIAASALLAQTSITVCSLAPFIPFVGGILCVTSLVTTAATIAACIIIDVRTPIEESVKFALEKGVTIVACAGNKSVFGKVKEFLPDEIEDRFLKIDQDIDAVVELWEVMPASISGVICVGEANSSPGRSNMINGQQRVYQMYENVGWYGSRVDIWAPGPGYNFRPDDDDIKSTPKLDLINFAGTSAATPYIAGLIANMQALNSYLNPSNPALSQAQKKAIPYKIKELLISSAWTNRELANQNIPNPRNERRNLINPMRLMQLSSDSKIQVNLQTRGYATTINFGEEEKSATNAGNDDVPDRARTVSITKDTSLNGTILSLKGEGGVPDSDDIDWIKLEAPPNGSGCAFASKTLELRFPRNFGEIKINDDSELPLSIRNTQDETIKTYSIPSLLPGSCYFLKVSGENGSDNLYKISIPRSTCSVPASPDRYDRKQENNNNTRARATEITPEIAPFRIVVIDNNPLFTMLRIRGCQGICDFPYRRMTIDKLNLHTLTDEDWFQFTIPPFPESDFPASACSKNSTFSIQPQPGVTFAFYDRYGQTTTKIDEVHYLQVKRTQREVCDAQFIQYKISITISVSFTNASWICNRPREFDIDLLADYLDPKTNLIPQFDPCTRCNIQTFQFDEPAINQYRKLYFNWDRRGNFKFIASNLSKGEFVVKLIDVKSGKPVKELSSVVIDTKKNQSANTVFEVTALKKGSYKLEVISLSGSKPILKYYLPKIISPSGYVSSEIYAGLIKN